MIWDRMFVLRYFSFLLFLMNLLLITVSDVSFHIFIVPLPELIMKYTLFIYDTDSRR